MLSGEIGCHVVLGELVWLDGRLELQTTGGTFDATLGLVETVQAKLAVGVAAGDVSGDVGRVVVGLETGGTVHFLFKIRRKIIGFWGIFLKKIEILGFFNFSVGSFYLREEGIAALK